METDTLSLSRLRPALAQNWLIGLFGIAYLVSQATILVIVAPAGNSFRRLPCFGFTACRRVTSLLVLYVSVR
jgi:hypothetical protein